ncbi:hypothetical protein EYF80_062301 [Liparis tanakae]|uniref:Uncharacterized protein n=1 Tax=Liparis tanakae TaxID=230148 RepID=A0A4Z2EGE9_9TELE|nr:hypothetical protein EYF80_062301 [Liparis tanakae]
MHEAVAPRAADMEGRRRGRGRARGKRHAWTAAVPQRSARGQSRGPREVEEEDKR